MYFLKDNESKIIFGWSGKCGCSHIKKIFYFLQNGRLDNEIHKKEEYEKDNFTFDKDDYIILFIRNPYERLVSGYLDKYNDPNKFFARGQWRSDKKLTFKNFVNELTLNGLQTINTHHFTPQLSENWTDKIKDHTNISIFDINNIPYDFLEYFFDKKIPDELKIKTNENKNNFVEKVDFVAYEAEYHQLKNIKPSYELFYNEEIKRDVTIFYAKDLVFFRDRGFSYTI